MVVLHMPKKVKKVCRILRRPLEWFAVWSGQTLISPLSLPGLLRLSRRIGDAACAFDRRGKAIARANLHPMFGARMTP